MAYGPRNVAGPVVRGADFWGRDSELAHIWSLLERGSVLLTGPRRHGKSSLMYALRDQPREDVEVILLDVEWVESPEEFLTTMAAELLAIDRVRKAVQKLRAAPSVLTRWISGAIDEIGVGVGSVGELKIRLRDDLKNPEQWPDLAEQMLGTLRNLPDRTVLILDEFPIMVSNMLARDEATALRFLRWFRTFRQSPGTERLVFLLGGSVNIEPRLEALGSEALLGDLQRFRLMPFDKGRSVAFVEQLLAEEAVKHDGDVPEVVVATCDSGVPYYLQVIVAECLAESRRLNSPLGVASIQSIYDEMVIGPINRHRFSHYHTRLRLYYGVLEQPARIILGQLCHGPKSIEELSDALATFGQDPSIIERVLVLLEADYYILREAETVSFGDGLLRDWWRRNSTLPRTK
jgi:hypothetical protein